MAGDGLRLLEWFRGRRRAFPWRTPLPRDPYAVVVAEVMAQQTQIERVVPAYGRFVARFPTLASLAAAAEDEVVHAFSGLGYYRRARSLHRAARAVVAQGAWPTTHEELRQLPGFGDYTAAAVAAFCFGGKRPPVDGNIARVAARVRALMLPLGSAKLIRAAEDLATVLFAETDTPEAWEALMELGATVCGPAATHCAVCPLASLCAGLAGGTPLAYPTPRPRRASERERWVAIWAERPDGRVLLRRVEAGGLLGGMWLPPFQQITRAGNAARTARALARAAGYAGELRAAAVVRHGITHRRITVEPFVVAVGGTTVAERRPSWSWQDWRAPSLPTSSLLAKLAAACGAGSDRTPDVAWHPEER